MLERIQMIDGVGSYSRTNPGRITFSSINIIYGENRNGKSTLCDIFYSLSLNDPQLILDRKSIVPNVEPNQVSQTIEVKFAGQDKVKFSNNSWETLPPENSKLYIFDHGFIHRNVMTGTSYNRENSTNVSSFILGENASQFEDLEDRNRQFRTDKRTLITQSDFFQAHGIPDVDVFVSSLLPVKTLDELDADIQISKDIQKGLSSQISNITQVMQRGSIKDLSSPVNIDNNIEEINNCLALSMENVHRESKHRVSAHKEKVNDAESFNGWAAKGVSHLEEDCPFCGQTLNDEAEALIDSYKTAFNEAFNEFVKSTKKEATRLQGIKLINSDINILKAIHEQNLHDLSTYTENSISEKLTEQASKDQLSESYAEVERSLNALNEHYETISILIMQALSDKNETPYNRADPVVFDGFNATLKAFNDSLADYQIHKNNINAILFKFKDEQDATALEALKITEVTNEAIITRNKKRLELDIYCVEYVALKNKIYIDKLSYDTDKLALETSQEIFLNTYFVEINTLFRTLGSSDFEISRKINRAGVKTVYDLEVKFKGRLVDKSKFHCLFSESDRRALAFCIFLAKIHQLPPEERAKAILVMDDPVTSFDSERISSILRILFTLKPSIKQMIITTHYKGMASAVMKKFNDAQAIKIIQNTQGSLLELATKSEMTATAHDERYAEIMDFVERRTQDNKLAKLRPFIEGEMRQRYKLPLISLGLTETTSFNDCIEGLKTENHVTEQVSVSLHDFRTTLNLPAHELESWSLDDCRTYAKDMMQFIYKDL